MRRAEGEIKPLDVCVPGAGSDLLLSEGLSFSLLQQMHLSSRSPLLLISFVREGGGGVVGVGGAQSSLLSVSWAVLILFVWPHTFPACLSGK